MKNHTIIFALSLMLFAPASLWSQATSQNVQNIGVSTDYLGWDALTNDDLSIESHGSALNQGIELRTGAGGPNAILVNSWGVGLGIVGTLPPLNIFIGSGNNPAHTGMRVATIVSSPPSQFSVSHAGRFAVRSNGTLNVAVMGIAGNVTEPISDVNFGVFARACTDPPGKSYALYGEARGQSNTSWAGFFEGDVFHSGSWPSSSDMHIKTGIEELSGCAEILSNLEPKKYEYRVEEFATLTLSKGTHFGFIAQDVDAHLPTLTKMARNLSRVNEDDEIVSVPTEFLSLNYIGMIPFIIGALQERQQVIDSQANAIDELTLAISSLELALLESLNEE